MELANQTVTRRVKEVRQVLVLTPEEADKLAFVLGDIEAEDTELDGLIEKAYNLLSDIAARADLFEHQRISREDEIRIVNF